MRVADEQNTCAYYRIKAVLLFPGQGAQKVGMGKDLYDTYPAAKAMMDAADAALGYSLTDIMFNGPDAELTRTCNCQPALYLHGLALYEILRSEVEIEPVAAAGLSLGEFTAHAAAGTFSMEDGLKIVQKRGAFMEEACQAAPSTMAAMIGGNDEAVQALAASCDVRAMLGAQFRGTWHGHTCDRRSNSGSAACNRASGTRSAVMACA